MKPGRSAVPKWTGASLCAVVLAAWVVSGRVEGCVIHKQLGTSWAAGIGGGCAWVGRQREGGPARTVSVAYVLGSASFKPEGWSAEYQTVDWHIRWLPHWFTRGSAPTSIAAIDMPVWVPLLAALLLTAFLFYHDRRSVRCARAGRCVGCGYDLSGLARGAACPECGKGRSS